MQSTNFENLNIAVLLPCYNEGAVIASVVLDFRRVLPGTRIYVCLLYTSPSPRDKRQSRMPSSA